MSSYQALHDQFWLACSKRSDSGERCEIKIAMKSRGGLGREVREPSLTSPLPRFYFFALLFSSHRSPLSERLEQAKFWFDKFSWLTVRLATKISGCCPIEINEIPCKENLQSNLRRRPGSRRTKSIY